MINEMDNNKSVKKDASRISQTLIPRVNIQEALQVAEALRDNFAAKSASPLDVAAAIDRSPSSSDWRIISGAAVAYGLTDGGYNAEQITLTELGKKIVMPQHENEDTEGLIKCATTPKILKDFYGKYNRNKFPRDDIAKNVLIGMGVPQERANEALNIVKENGKYVGILIAIKDGTYIQLSRNSQASTNSQGNGDETDLETDNDNAAELKITPPPDNSLVKKQSENLFISHGKNKQILDQLKTMLELGSFIPIIAEEHETAAIPVSEKVLGQMRDCGAAVISVTADQGQKSELGEYTVNQNVLIEIGAAFVLYNERVILVWDKRVKVPSNLQGLYRCEYEGDELTWSAGTRLQKALLSIKRGEKPNENS